MLTYKNTAKPIKVLDIEQIETEFGRPFPQQYRDFLLQTNGGQPKPNVIDIEGADFGETDIQVFHGIGDEIVSCDLRWNWENLEGCKENLILPIARDSLGHSFGLVLDDENYGHVYYFDSREYPPQPYYLADDFHEFLSKIRDWTPEERAEIEEAARANKSD